MVIWVQEVIECELIVNSSINGQNENVIIEGKGYYKEDGINIVVYFASGDVKYKYVFEGDILMVSCNDSVYRFKENSYEIGKIKNGDYVFEITTFASKIEINNRVIVLEYNLSQNGQIIGFYKSKLSF